MFKKGLVLKKVLCLVLCSMLIAAGDPPIELQELHLSLSSSSVCLVESAVKADAEVVECLSSLKEHILLGDSAVVSAYNDACKKVGLDADLGVVAGPQKGLVQPLALDSPTEVALYLFHNQKALNVLNALEDTYKCADLAHLRDVIKARVQSFFAEPKSLKLLIEESQKSEWVCPEEVAFAVAYMPWKNREQLRLVDTRLYAFVHKSHAKYEVGAREALDPFFQLDAEIQREDKHFSRAIGPFLEAVRHVCGSLEGFDDVHYYGEEQSESGVFYFREARDALMRLCSNKDKRVLLPICLGQNKSIEDIFPALSLSMASLQLFVKTSEALSVIEVWQRGDEPYKKLMVYCLHYAYWLKMSALLPEKDSDSAEKKVMLSPLFQRGLKVQAFLQKTLASSCGNVAEYLKCFVQFGSVGCLWSALHEVLRHEVGCAESVCCAEAKKELWSEITASKIDCQQVWGHLSFLEQMNCSADQKNQLVHEASVWLSRSIDRKMCAIWSQECEWDNLSEGVVCEIVDCLNRMSCAKSEEIYRLCVQCLPITMHLSFRKGCEQSFYVQLCRGDEALVTLASMVAVQGRAYGPARSYLGYLQCAHPFLDWWAMLGDKEVLACSNDHKEALADLIWHAIFKSSTPDFQRVLGGVQKLITIKGKHVVQGRVLREIRAVCRHIVSMGSGAQERVYYFVCQGNDFVPQGGLKKRLDCARNNLQPGGLAALVPRRLQQRRNSDDLRLWGR